MVLHFDSNDIGLILIAVEEVDRDSGRSAESDRFNYFISAHPFLPLIKEWQAIIIPALKSQLLRSNLHSGSSGVVLHLIKGLSPFPEDVKG
jgi:hypothetical protein